MTYLTNRHTDPNCLKKYGTFKCTAVASVGKYAYTREAGAADNAAAVTGLFPSTLPVGTIVGILTSVPADKIGLQNATLVKTYGKQAAAYRITGVGDHALWLNTADPVIPVNAFIYTADDYAIAEGLGLAYDWPWFTGDTMPLN